MTNWIKPSKVDRLIIETKRRGMMICDREGVPRIVQRLDYLYTPFILKIVYFDGQLHWIEPAAEVEITDRELTEVQRLACVRDAEKRWAPKC